MPRIESGPLEDSYGPIAAEAATEIGADPEFELTPGENAFLWVGIIGGLAVFAWGVSVLFSANPF